jgi:uncharacterized membrane protein YphA (DoxX/SURF4 family)
VNIVLWIIAVVLALAFLASGAMKLTRSREQIIESGQGWAGDVRPGTIKLIGALEVLGAIGLVLPGLVGVATILTPLAAVGLALIMVGAAVVHGRRGETPMIGINVVLLVLALVVAIGRFGPVDF